MLFRSSRPDPFGKEPCTQLHAGFRAHDKPVVKQSTSGGGFGAPGAPTAGPTTPTEDPNPFASLMLSAAQPGQELQKALNQPDVKEQLARSREDSMLRLLADMRAAKEGD